jgi:hypothetical protein
VAFHFHGRAVKEDGSPNLRIDSQPKATAERAADDQRSLTSLAEKQLTDHLKAEGHLGGEQLERSRKGTG